MSRPFLLGLTGSIGMGKSTTAKMFRDAGIPVWDADKAVSEAYDAGGRAVEAVGGLFPEALVDGRIDRKILRDRVAKDGASLRALERIVHPIVSADRQAFIDGCKSDLAVLEIPLLFETEADQDVDAVAVVSAPEPIQEKRVMARPGMTRQLFERLRGQQMPDEKKRRRADYVIDTSTIETAEAAVNEIIEELRQRNAKGSRS